MNDVLATPVAHAVGLALVHFVWQGAAIGLATACLLAWARHRSAGLRYAIACAGLVALAAAPVVTTVFPLSISPSPAQLVTAQRFQLVTGQDTVVFSDNLEMLPLGVVNAPLAAWLPWVVLAWSLGVLLMTVRLTRGWLAVQRIRRQAERLIASPLRDTLDRIAAELGVRKPVRFFESSLVDVPTVIGWLRPTILVPASALAGLAPAQMEAILAHELAHIRRYDYLVNGLQNVVETVLFYHPAVWWVSGEMRREREHCCDDLAVALVGSRVTYAGALATLEESRQKALAFGMAATGGDLVARVRRVLGAPGPRRHQPSMLLAAAVLVGVSAVGLAGRTYPAGPIEVSPTTASNVTSVEPAPAEAAPSRVEIAPDSIEPTPMVPAGPTGPPQTTMAPQVAVPQTTWEVELREVEERFRMAKIQNDVGTLALLLDDAFSGTNQNGNTRNKTQFLELFSSFTIRFISQTITGVQATFERAVVTGSMIEQNAGIDMMLFTRVWVRNGTTWQLLSNTQFRDPQQRVVAAPNPVDGAGVRPSPSGGVVNVPGRSGVVTIAPRSPIPAPIAPTRPDWPPVHVGGDIREPRKIRDVRPIYPKIAQAAGVSGVVIIEAAIDETGAVKDARVLRSIPMLDQAALDAVLQWRYTPTILNGVPTAITMTATVHFQLPVVPVVVPAAP